MFRKYLFLLTSFYLFLSIAPINAQAATLQFIPDTQLMLNIPCGGNPGSGRIICNNSFSINDTVFWNSYIDCRTWNAFECTDTQPYVSMYSIDPMPIINAVMAGYNQSEKKYGNNYTTILNCKYASGTLYQCDMRGTNTVFDETKNVNIVTAIYRENALKAQIVQTQQGCPNNGVYFSGKGCTTNGYTDSNGIFYQTNRTIASTKKACVICPTSSEEDNAPNHLSNDLIGDPISVAARSVIEEKVDINFPIPFKRNYTSSRNELSSLGGWKHNYSNQVDITTSKDSIGDFPAILIFKLDNDEEIIFTRTHRTDPFILLYKDQIGASVNYDNTNYVLSLPNGGTQTYNSFGNLTKINYVNGMIYTLTRDSADKLIKITNIYGQWISFVNSGFLITQINASNGDFVNYTYSNNMLVSASLNNSPTVSYAYNGMLLVGIIDELGKPYASFLYNANGDAIQNARMLNDYKIQEYNFTYNNDITYVTQPNGNTTTYHLAKYLYQDKITSFEQDNRKYTLNYDTNGNLTTYTNYKDSYYYYTYDTNNLITTIQRPNNTIQAKTWDTNLRLPLTISEPYTGGTRTITYTYDQFRNMATKNISNGTDSRTWTYNYAAGGNLLTALNPNGTGLTYTYYDNTANINVRGLLRHIKNSANQTMSINSYDIRANPTSITGFDGVTKFLTYNLHGKVLTETVGLGTNSYTYNDSDDMLTINLATGYIMTMEYDDAHRLINMYDNNGGSVNFTIDDSTGVITNQDILQNNTLVATRNKIIDSLGRMTSFYHSNSAIATIYTYNGDDSIHTVTDPNGVTTTNTTNNIGILTNVLNPGYNLVNTLNLDGNVTNAQFGGEQNTQMTYNVFNEITQLISPDTGTHSYSYNLANKNVSHTDAASTVHTIKMDNAGRPLIITHVGTTGTLTENLNYNLTGTLNYIQDNSGITSYIYDIYNRLIKKTQNINGKLFNVLYGYNDANQLISETYPSGLIVNYNYINGILNSIITSGSSSSTLVDNISYQSLKKLPVSWNLYGSPVNITYSTEELLTQFSDNNMDQIITTDNTGNVKTLVDSMNAINISASYNTAYQITGGNFNGGILDYRYDYSSLNQTFKKMSDVGSIMGFKINTNILTNYQNPNYYSIVSDVKGNIISDNNGGYIYDLNNNMVSSNSNNVIATYKFNALNQRVSKTIAGVTTYFIYNERQQLIGEYNANGNVVSEHIYFGLRPVGLYQNNQIYTVHTDYLSTPRIITDSGNNPVWKWLNTTTHGNHLPSLELINYNLRFAGQYFDNENKLHYNYYRTYNPLIVHIRSI